MKICSYRKRFDARTERGTMNLHQPLTVLPGVGPKSAEKFTKLGIESLQDLLLYFPFRYEDFKSKNILETCRILVDKYESKVPYDMDSLTKLPGVGRKTANVVRSCAFNIPSLAVDTHVFRVTNRIGIIQEDNVLDSEFSLMKKLKKSSWNKAHHLFIFHGRRLCKSRKPCCEKCIINTECLYYKNL